MDSLALPFSSSGRLAQKPFAIAVVAVYGLMFMSQMLLSPPVSTRGGVLPFALMQALLAWIWYAIHAKRMRDAGHSTGSAMAIAILYALSIVLFLLVVEVLFGISAKAGATLDQQSSSLAPLVILLFLLTLLTGDGSISLFFYVALVITLVMFLPFLIAFAFSIFAATRPSLPAVAPAPA
jgi:uncharacterized membrane protein YhaH (DUF805 family)